MGLRDPDLARACPDATSTGPVDAVRSALRGRTDVRLVVLFGSRARGRERDDSDVDLAVLGDADPLTLAAELSLGCGRAVDVVALDVVGYPLLRAIVRDGIVLHEGRRGVGAAWRARALSTLETDRPWYERMRDAYLRRLASGGA